MQILPVLDLMGGKVVRGVGGRRDEYRPIVSPLCRDADPFTVAAALVDRFGFREAYVADLDAIMHGAPPDWDAYEKVADAGLRLWVDAGVADASRARQLAEFNTRLGPVAKVIAGLESLKHVEQLEALLSTVGPQRLVFSLDMKDGQPLIAGVSAWRENSTPLGIASCAMLAGVRSMIVLDLAGVGSRDGVCTLELCRQLREAFPAAELVAGGGVRTIDDLHALADAGCNAALVATALHEGTITPDDVRRLR